MDDKDITLHDEARRLYFSNMNLTLKDVSDEIGVPYLTVRQWSRDEQWSVQRSVIEISKLDSDIFKQADMIRRTLFKEIVAGTHGGKELVALTESWLSIIGIVQPAEDEIDRDALLADLED